MQASLLIFALLFFVANATPASREYNLLPFISGSVRSVAEFDRFVGNFRQISLISFNVYRSSTSWNCGVNVVPKYDDPRVNGKTTDNYYYSNFTTTIYGFESFKLVCDDVVYIEYQILEYPLSQENKTISASVENIGAGAIVGITIAIILFVATIVAFAVHIRSVGGKKSEVIQQIINK
jgi:hypothetical protein